MAARVNESGQFRFALNDFGPRAVFKWRNFRELRGNGPVAALIQIANQPILLGSSQAVGFKIVRFIKVNGNNPAAKGIHIAPFPVLLGARQSVGCEGAGLFKLCRHGPVAPLVKKTMFAALAGGSQSVGGKVARAVEFGGNGPGAAGVDIAPLIRGLAGAGCGQAIRGERARPDKTRGNSYATGKGIMTVRKAGKLPRETFREEYSLEYGTAAVEIHCNDFPAGTRVLLLDDILATGGTLVAAAKLVERAQLQVVGIGVLLELDGLGGRTALESYHVESLSAVTE